MGESIPRSGTGLCVVQEVVEEASHPPLNAREQEVMALAGKGMSNQEIADALVMTVETVRCHLKNIYRKLDLPRRAALIQYVVEQKRG